MWTDDPDFVESCDFYRSLSNFDSIDSIGAYAATNTFAYVKAPNLKLMGYNHEIDRLLRNTDGDPSIPRVSYTVCCRFLYWWPF